MASSIPMGVDNFRANFDGGTRPNRFVVTGQIGGTQAQAVNNLYVKAASMPSSTMGIIQVPFRGRVIKLPGDRAYPEWTFTMLDETTDKFRESFEAWNETFNRHLENTIDGGGAGGVELDDTELFTQWSVSQVDMNGDIIRTTLLKNCWPVEVGAVDLTYDAADTLTEYSVTLAYDYIQIGADSPEINNVT